MATHAYAAIVSDLSAEFERRSHQFDENRMNINLFSNSFAVSTDGAPPQLQMELIDLQADERLKSQHRIHDLIGFYCDYFKNSKEKYPNIYSNSMKADIDRIVNKKQYTDVYLNIMKYINIYI